jgi:hypothetical protein
MGTERRYDLIIIGAPSGNMLPNAGTSPWPEARAPAGTER